MTLEYDSVQIPLQYGVWLVVSLYRMNDGLCLPANQMWDTQKSNFFRIRQTWIQILGLLHSAFATSVNLITFSFITCKMGILFLDS